MATCCLVLQFLLLEATCPESKLLVHLAYQLLLYVNLILFSVAALPVLCIKHRLIGPGAKQHDYLIYSLARAQLFLESEGEKKGQYVQYLPVYSPN